MPFKTDILILHSGAENEQDAQAETWLLEFKRYMELMLIQISGEQPQIVTRSAQELLSDREIEEIAIVIPVLSKTFIRSGKCMSGLEKFCAIKQKKAPVILKALKEPIPAKEQPLVLKKYLSFNLYDDPNESLGEAAFDYNGFFNPEGAQKFWMKMVDLAHEAHESLFLIKHNREKPASKVRSGKYIYLAVTGDDLTIKRNIIKRELLKLGYTVLPKKPLPEKVTELKAVVKKEIEKSSLSIHLIGSNYGELPEGSDRSVADIQNQIAAEKSSALKDKGEFSRLVWITPNLQHASEKQQIFVENIKRDLASSERAEIVQTALEDFKNLVREELLEAGTDHQRIKHKISNLNGKVKVYMLYDKVDEQDVIPIKKFIEKTGYQVLLPSFEGNLLDLRQHHISNLKNLDAAVIFQGSVNNDWVRMKLLDLLKAPGYGRKKPVAGKALISKNEKHYNLNAYKNHQLFIINDTNKKGLDKLKAFLSTVKT